MACGQIPATPAPPPVGLRPKSAAPCHGSADGCTASRQPPRRGRNATAGESPEPYRGGASGEARPLLRGAQRPRGGGKLRGYAAHARRARERPFRALFSAVGFGELSGFGRWERPQPELSLQLVYPWGAAVTCGYWQGTPGDSKGPGGGSFGVLLWVLSLTQRKYPACRGGTRQSPPPQAAHLKRPGGARKRPSVPRAEHLRRSPAGRSAANQLSPVCLRRR